MIPIQQLISQHKSSLEVVHVRTQFGDTLMPSALKKRLTIIDETTSLSNSMINSMVSASRKQTRNKDKFFETYQPSIVSVDSIERAILDSFTSEELSIEQSDKTETEK
jgi:hypothetical protein